MSQLQVTGNALFKTNVGIGTLVPQTTLSIENSGTQNVISPIITSQSSGTTYAGMYSIRDGAGDQRGLLFQNYTANVGLTEKMRITSAGNVGIGTSSPAYPLQVRRAGGGGSLGISIDSVGATDRAVQYFAIQDSASGAGAGHAFYYRTPSSTTDTLGLLLNEDGNVGIGTSSPSSLLTVAGATDLAWSAGTSKLQILRSGSQARINNYESGSGSSIAIAWDGGNVLIGTTTDNGARLQINGTSNFTGNLTINDGSLIKLGQGSSSNVSIDFFASNFGAGYEGRIMGLNSDGNTHFYHRNGSATFTDIGYFNNTGMYITYYGTYSDMRLKDVIETNPNIDLDAIDVIKYTLKSNPSLIRYGYSAQQVQSVLPDLVTLNKKIDENDEDATLMLNYNDLYVLKIAALEKKLRELTEEVSILKGTNN